MNIKLKNTKSFTLVEILVSVSIFTFLIAAVYTTFLVGNRSWATSSAKVALQREIRWALFGMTKELREAKDIFITNDMTSTKLTFRRPAVGQVSFTFNSIGNDANKIIREDESKKRVLARDISSLAFTYLTTDAIIVEITATKKPVFGPEIKLQLKEKVVIRL